MKITIELDPTDPRDAGVAQAFAAAMSALGGRDVGSVNVPASSPVVAQPKQPIDMYLDQLWPHLGPEIRGMLKGAASFAGPFTLTELATKLKKNLDTVRSWHRNLGRAEKRAREGVVGAPDLMAGVWNRSTSMNTYEMNPAVRAAILGRP